MPSQLHAVIFNKAKWNHTTARKWLKHEGYIPIKRARHTTNYIRYRIRDPELFKRFSTVDLNNGIMLVLGYKR